MGESAVIPLIRANPRTLKSATREELTSIYEHYRGMGNEWVRRMVLDHDRIDILATLVLGYQVKPFHLAMLQYQFRHPKNLQLVFRGAGKSTICTVTKSIHLLLKDPNLRILIASKTTQNAEGFLKEIKGHFEGNERLEEIFGPYYDPRKVGKWDNREIEIVPRTKNAKEASITCVGVDGTIVSKHYDVMISDDLVDEDNARTEYMRDKTRTWFYQTLDPCLEPPDSNVPHRGEHHMLGTKYHFDDLYGRLSEGELKGRVNVIPALSEEGLTPWPEKYPVEWFEDKKKHSGVIIFNCQYQCDAEAMKGEVFQYDDCQIVNDNDIPSGLRVFMGCDLAISQKKKTADQFAIVVGGFDVAGNIYVLDFFAGHLRFNQQVTKFFQFYDKFDPIWAGSESNAYQDALRQAIKDRDREVRVIPLNTDKDKMTRAWKLTPLFESKRVFFRKGMDRLIDQFVLFPGYKYKDLIDAFDLMIRASRRKKRRKRRGIEPGVI
jgi:phage terminase large subunit-like protein